MRSVSSLQPWLLTPLDRSKLAVVKDYPTFLVFNCLIKSVAFVYDLRPSTLTVLCNRVYPWLDSREQLEFA